MKATTPTRSLPRLSLRAKVLAVLFALTAAVALPQICHVAGKAFGLGTSIGEMLLPIHLPILLAALLAGPAVGGIAGLAAPLISFLLSGMPAVTALPFMCIELAAYGLAAGALRAVKLPVIVKLLIAQLAGRALRWLCILVAAAGGHTALAASSVWTAIGTGLVGLALQWTLIPLAVFAVEKLQKHEK